MCIQLLFLCVGSMVGVGNQQNQNNYTLISNLNFQASISLKYGPNFPP